MSSLVRKTPFLGTWRPLKGIRMLLRMHSIECLETRAQLVHVLLKQLVENEMTVPLLARKSTWNRPRDSGFHFKLFVPCEFQSQTLHLVFWYRTVLVAPLFKFVVLSSKRATSILEAVPLCARTPPSPPLLLPPLIFVSAASD